MNGNEILLIEDNADDVFITRRAFVRSQVTNDLVVARDGPAALDLLLSPQPGKALHPALVLLDLSLPKMSGLELLDQLRDDPRTASLPVGVLTSCSADEAWVCGHRSGVNVFVRKPVEFEDLSLALTRLGLSWTLTVRASVAS